jgi:dTDP-4-dehydrorhamnose 3,5-epimerase
MKKSELKSEVKGVVFFDLEFNRDARGSIVEMFRNDLLDEVNFPKMTYMIHTLPGVVRGPHEHIHQSDFLCFMGPGDFELILWEKSGTYPFRPYDERHVVGENRPVAVIIPPGVVHAFKNISDRPGVVYNAPNRLFEGPGRCYPVDEVRHEESPDFII